MKRSILNIKQALIIFSACFCLSGAAQNLVPNNSFEILDSCHNSWTPNDCSISFTNGWTCLANSTADIYLGCNGSVPNLSFGIPVPQDGLNYIGIIAYSKYTPNIREYASIRLYDTLTAYHAYRCGYYVSLNRAMGARYEVRNMSMALADTFIYNGPDFGILPYTPQIINQVNNPLNSTDNNWIMVCDTFFAQGTEKYIAIGNLFDDATTNALYSGISANHSDSSCYYYIDNVFVEEIPGLIGTKEFTTKEPRIKLFPNPNAGEFTIEQNEELSSTLQIFDINGKLVGKYSLKGSSNIIKLNNLENGIYFYTIASGDKILKRDKIVVIH